MKKPRYKASESILAIVAGLILAYFLFDTGEIVLLIALIVALLSILIPPFATMLHYAWFYLGTALGYVVAPVVLSIVYFVFLTPIAQLKKLFHRPSSTNRNSAWVEINKTYSPNDFDDLW